MIEKRTKNYADAEVNDDFGVVLTHPELIQERPAASREWLENHKAFMIAMGGTALAGLGVLTGGLVFSHRRKLSLA